MLPSPLKTPCHVRRLIGKHIKREYIDKEKENEISQGSAPRRLAIKTLVNVKGRGIKKKIRKTKPYATLVRTPPANNEEMKRNISKNMHVKTPKRAFGLTGQGETGHKFVE